MTEETLTELTDRSWGAVCRPGEARTESYFDPHGERVPFIASYPNFDVTNAWWLSELARVVYNDRRENLLGPTGDVRALSRAAGLARGGFRERAFFDEPLIQAGIFETDAGVEEPFAALVFRGTDSLRDWRTNLRFGRNWRDDAHRGFAEAFESIRKRVKTAVAEIESPVFITGHSLGGALAIIAYNRLKKLENVISTYTFAAPRPGGARFRYERVGEGPPIFNVLHTRDIVPKLPFARLGYSHVGFSERIWPEPGDRRRFFGPPLFISEHAPINYSIRLAKLMQKFAPPAPDARADQNKTPAPDSGRGKVGAE